MKKCKVCGREIKKYAGRGMCEKHYQQYRKYGKTLDTNPRTLKDLNEIVEYEDYAEIILYNKQCEETARALIDLEDIEKVKDYKWSIHNKGYVANLNNGWLLHRLVMDCPSDMVVDHINHNKFDNRKSNLRVCTQQQNMMNQSTKKTNTSGCSGIYLDRRVNKWVAQITYNYKQISLGHYKTKEEAIEARKQAEIDLFGEYRNDDKGVS